MLPIIIYGTTLGFTLALIAIGLSLVFGVGRIINFAHGAFFAISSYSLYLFFISLKFPLIISIVLSLILTAAISVIMYIISLSRVRGMELNEMIITLAFTIITIEILRMHFGPSPLGVPSFMKGGINIGGYIIDMQRIFIVVISVVTLIILAYIVKKTKIGIGMRAVAQDEDAAMLIGVNREHMCILALVISAILAGIAGITITPVMTASLEGAWYALLNGIAIVILGGLGSLLGSLIAAFIIGYAEIIIATYVSSHLKTIVALIFIIIILILRPSGILGKHHEIEERV
jgi:branched-chain amino acid transport system permease protein